MTAVGTMVLPRLNGPFRIDRLSAFRKLQGLCYQHSRGGAFDYRTPQCNRTRRQRAARNRGSGRVSRGSAIVERVVPDNYKMGYSAS
jgi:hypothetical protein